MANKTISVVRDQREKGIKLNLSGMKSRVKAQKHNKQRVKL